MRVNFELHIFLNLLFKFNLIFLFLFLFLIIAHNMDEITNGL
jgi:hypothetical protein